MRSNVESSGEGSLLFGVILAVVVLTALDLVHLHVLSLEVWWPSAPLAWLGLLLWALALGAALLPITAAFTTTVRAMAERARAHRLLRNRPFLADALTVSIMCALPLASVAWWLFQGRGVAQMPLLATVGPLVTFALGIGGILAAWIARSRWATGSVRSRWLGFPLVTLIIFGLFFADARLFVGLYGFVHVALSCLVLWVLVVAARALHPRRPGAGPTSRRGRVVLLLGGATTTAASLLVLALIFRVAPATRADLIERTLYASRGLALVARVIPLGAAPNLEPTVLTFEEIERGDLEGFALTTAPSGERPNVLLLSIDAVNADRFPGRGYPREVMPTIDALLPQGVRFDRAYTTVPETQYALPGLIMSTTRDLGPAAAVRESGANIATAMRSAGYSTAWVYEARDLFRGGGVLNNLEFEGFDGRYGLDDTDPFALADRVISLFEASGNRPTFIWAHIFAPHAPYTPPEEFRRFGEGRSDLYDGELLLSDEIVRRILEALRIQGRLEQTIVVVTADHGEWTGENGRFGHGADVRERTVNVPLFFIGPGVERGSVVNTPVSLIDVGPTLLEMVGASLPASFEGVSLAPALRGEPFDRGLVTTWTAGREHAAAMLGDNKLVFNQTKTVIRLYNIAQDRGETRDLSTLEPGRVREMMAHVAALDLERDVTARVASDGAAATLELYSERIRDDSLSAAERTLAARAMGWVDAPESAGVLLELLRAPLPRPVRQWLAHSLFRRGANGHAREAFTHARARRDADPMVQALTIRSLAQSDVVTEALEEWSDDRSVHLRRAAATLLMPQEGGAHPNAATSARLLADDDPLVRALALRSIDRLEVTDRHVILERALADAAPQVRLAAAATCGQVGESCFEDALSQLSTVEDVVERLALLRALGPSLTHEPERWATLLDGPPAQRALAYRGLASTTGAFDELLVRRLEIEDDAQAREALIRTIGERQIVAARHPLLRQITSANRALGLAATDAMVRIGLEQPDVGVALNHLARTRDMQTRLDLVRVLGRATRIDDPRGWRLLEALRRTPRKDHHLIRALVGAYGRVTDPRAERFRVDQLRYDNFGYHFWLYGVSLHPRQPRAGDVVHLRTIWSIRWNQPPVTRHILQVEYGGDEPLTIERREVAGRPVDQWPTCRIMFDEATFRVPASARRLTIATGWRRGSRVFPLVYGERQTEEFARLFEVEVRPPASE